MSGGGVGVCGGAVCVTFDLVLRKFLFQIAVLCFYKIWRFAVFLMCSFVCPVEVVNIEVFSLAK